jgi:hypothetical protein
MVTMAKVAFSHLGSIAVPFTARARWNPTGGNRTERMSFRAIIIISKCYKNMCNLRRIIAG